MYFLFIIHFCLDSSCLHLIEFDWARIYCGSFSENFNKNNEFKVENNTIIDVEVNMKNRTIYYFINNKQCPFYVNNISSSCLLFGISAYYSSSIIEIISIKKHQKSSFDSSAKCEAIEWNRVYYYYYFYYYYFRK
jgi:hypothetical protein